ncbi:LEAF RUST 10 DISEASE-RESISTANCE LOCUS RECEPTOR-LIKE PROTEIN KINASE-like 1.4 isoform X3 [Durio zibethinus]|uniref:non-specific serine/threonine protein kinase n=1 Tax=Durio zibethinus TaxID=66656 RepID=A0A6P6A3D5_DURZI|nr:LEAF RUST 10 DISEASE-RESISTANCE LOCUS RECEPTOR-LIKE PROTEIN KINASE-like 1.4 isoform X3 [Durio zibethinus]
MHPIPTPPLLFLLLLHFLHHTTAFPLPDNSTLSGCNQTFSCGEITNLGYPFTGGPRPAHCGPPGFRLTCSNNTILELLSDSLTYRVIKLDPQTQTMTLSRSDLYNNPIPCMLNFTNTTLNSTIFTLTSANQNLTLFYGCYSLNSSSFHPLNLFSCNNTGAYYVVGPVPSDPVFKIIQCNVSVIVPILGSAVNALLRNRSLLGEVLMEGFDVNYTIPQGDECSKCPDSGGECGWLSGRAVCICGDRICDTKDTNKQDVSLPIGLAIAGAAIVGILLGMGILRYRQQRRKKIADQDKSRDLPTPPSSTSKGPPTSTTNLSQSIPSYPTSNLDDLEKRSTYFGAHVFRYEELEEATDNFNPSKELGEGGFGTVYYGVLNDGRVVAVKRLFESNFKRVDQYMNEIEILTRIRHPNLVTLYGCTSRRSRELLLVYEYIPNGTVADHLHGKLSNSGLLAWPVRLSIAVETANALAYLHSSDIIHRDVKTNNILLDKDCHVKVADFGLSRLFPNDVTHVSTAPQGTPGYVDPEYYQCYQLTEKSDVYSFGVVLIELISAKQAVDTNRHRHDINLANMAISRIQNHALHELVDPSLGFENDHALKTMITAIAELAFRCLQQERDMRPSMEEVLEALRGIKDGELVVKKAEIVDITSEAEVVDIRSEADVVDIRSEADVVDIRSDDVGLLKHIPPPLSPDSETDKWLQIRSM